MPSPKRQLHDLQMALYEKAYLDAHALVPAGHQSIIRYSDRFEASLPNAFRVIGERTLFDQLAKAAFCLFGDFHTLKQSQRVLVRVCRQIFQRDPQAKILFALECFRASDQPLLDAYMAGELAEAAFLRKIQYYQYWGFPWPHFRMVLEFASDMGIPVFGINTDRAGLDTLGQRDAFAAKVILDVREQYPDHQVLCLVGEYHLADEHLPRFLEREVRRRKLDDRIVRILSNVDRYYFDVSQSHSLTHTQYLRLKSDLYCIMNSPPWMKWQSYAIFEEMRSMSEEGVDGIEHYPHESDFDSYTEQTFDFDHQIQNLVYNLASFLEIRVAKMELAGFHVFTGTEADLIEDFLQESPVSGKEIFISRIVDRAVHDGVFYSPAHRTILLTDYSINNMAEAAGLYLFHVSSGFAPSYDATFEGFYGRVVQSCIGMFSSLVFNPRRKCMDLYHCRKFLEHNARRHLVGPARVKREASRQLLRHHEWILDKLGRTDAPRPLSSLFDSDVRTSYEVSRRIGHVIGHRFYQYSMRNVRGSKMMRDLILAKLDDRQALWEAVRSIYAVFARYETAVSENP